MTPTERAALLREADALVERGTGREWPVLRDLAAEVRALEAEVLATKALLLRVLVDVGPPHHRGDCPGDCLYCDAAVVADVGEVRNAIAFLSARPAPARLDADRTATGRTILTAPMRGDGCLGSAVAGPGVTHVDTETGVRTALVEAKCGTCGGRGWVPCALHDGACDSRITCPTCGTGTAKEGG